jgi:hypothetical protein
VTYRAYQTRRRTPSMRGGGTDFSARSRTRWRSGGSEKDGEGANRHNGAQLRRDFPLRRQANRATAEGWEVREGRGNEK